MSSPKPVLAFFGATGGCACHALVLAVKAGYAVQALVRTPSKLKSLLTSTHGISEDILKTHLTIIQGDIRNISSVKQALTTPTNTIVTTIISGIGSIPKLQWSIRKPITGVDESICRDGMATILAALRELHSEGVTGKPLVAAISTTGISKVTRDVPWLYMPLYHYLLAVPHKDKRNMENLLIEAAAETQANVDDFVIVKPTLLTDGVAKGLEVVRVGWERPLGREGEKGSNPAIGYYISRADVGGWLFEEVVKKGKKWAGKSVSLTY